MVILFWILLSLLVLLIVLRIIKRISFSSSIKEKMNEIKLVKELDSDIIKFNKKHKNFIEKLKNRRNE